MQAFLKDIRDTVKANKSAKQENLIRLLNPKIRGWANYHRGSVAAETFAKVDHEVCMALWQWARRRHQHKAARWIKARYFKVEGTRSWVFAVDVTMPDGGRKRVSLVNPCDTKIRRHVKIRGEANPYDPKQETYFEDRLGWKMQGSLMGQGRLLRLWWGQDKRCPVCEERITRESGWHVHHTLPKSEGGKDNLSNLVMVHPNCHRQIHSRKLNVAKPAPGRGL